MPFTFLSFQKSGSKFRNLYLFHENFYKQLTANTKRANKEDTSHSWAKCPFKLPWGQVVSHHHQSKLISLISCSLCPRPIARELTKVVKIQSTTFIFPSTRIKTVLSSFPNELAWVQIASILIAVGDDVVVKSDCSFDCLHRVFVVLKNGTPQNTESAAQDTKGIFHNAPRSWDSEILKTRIIYSPVEF